MPPISIGDSLWVELIRLPSFVNMKNHKNNAKQQSLQQKLSPITKSQTTNIDWRPWVPLIMLFVVINTIFYKKWNINIDIKLWNIIYIISHYYSNNDNYLHFRWWEIGWGRYHHKCKEFDIGHETLLNRHACTNPRSSATFATTYCYRNVQCNRWLIISHKNDSCIG